jgi:hypothetical protein
LKKEHFVMDSKETREDKLEKPHTHFDRPQDILADPALSKEEKAEALEKLEQDAWQLTMAAQEGMTGGEENNLKGSRGARRLAKLCHRRQSPLQARTRKWPLRQRSKSLILETADFRRAIMTSKAGAENTRLNMDLRIAARVQPAGANRAPT